MRHKLMKEDQFKNMADLESVELNSPKVGFRKFLPVHSGLIKLLSLEWDWIYK